MNLKSFLATVFVIACVSSVHAGERVTTDSKGRIIPHPLAEPDPIQNPWPQAWEEGLTTQRDKVIQLFKGTAGVNTALENEKLAYPRTILAFCAGDRDKAISALESPDVDNIHQHTSGIDYYWCFTIKGQMRKYFFLGQYLTPEYLTKMKQGATAWVATDPRPNTELVLLTDAPNSAVAIYAMETMKKLWRNKAQLVEMADKAEAEGDANKVKFAQFIRTFAQTVGDTPPTDPAGWRQWWAALCQGDWLVFEEYDRRTNLRPHPQFGIGTGPVGAEWSPQVRGGVVDWRNTDNLRAMRETSVYLMAEETGSESVRQIYKEKIRTTARNFWSIGNGEWDSPSYLSHTATAYLNLYDFAKDDEVRRLAKAILDYIMTSAALKYNRGSMGAPNRRDYGTLTPECGPSDMVHFWASKPGDKPRQDEEAAYYATTSYRPPAAVVALARKELAKPVEILASHPTYQTWLPGKDAAPQNHETQYIANSYQIGTMLEGGDYDGAGGKILVANAEGGTDFVVPSSQAKGNICVNRSNNDRIAQYRNLLLYINKPKDGQATVWNIFVPKTTTMETANGIIFLKFHNTWAALRGANTTFGGIDSKAGDTFVKGGLPGAILTGKGDSPGLAGFAMEWGEQQSHGDYDAFKKAVLEKAKLDSSGLSEGKLVYTSALGESVGLQWNGTNEPKVWRNGQLHDLANHMALWQPANGTKSPLSLGWKEGILHVEAGGHTFTGKLDLVKGTYTFDQTLAK